MSLKRVPSVRALAAQATHTAKTLENQRERDVKTAQMLADKTAKFNQQQAAKETIFQNQQAKKAAQAAWDAQQVADKTARIAHQSGSKEAIFQAQQAKRAAQTAKTIARLTGQTTSIAANTSSASTAIPAASTDTTGQLVSTPAATTSDNSTATGFTPSGYDPNAILTTYAADGSSDPNTPAPVLNPAPVSTASDSGSYVPSGYDPNAILQTYADDPANVVLSSSPSVITTPIDNSDINQLTSDPVMRTKLLAVKQSNPEYYAFISNYMRSNPGVTSTLQGMGDDATTATGGSSSLAQIFSSILTPISNAYAAKVSNSGLTPLQQQQKLTAMQRSNATLTGTDSEKMMYLFGGLALLGIAWYATHKR